MRLLFLRIIDLFSWILGGMLAVFFPCRIRKLLYLFRNKVLSYALAPQFRRFGKGAYVAHNVVLVNPCYVSIGNGTSLGERTVVTAWDRYENDRFTPEIIIGDNSSIGADSHITAINRIVIGNGVLTGKKITITDNSHGNTTADQMDIPPMKRSMVSVGPVTIDDNVWIGEKATILPGVHIGRGAIIGANAVVTHDVPEGCVAAEIPAKIIKRML